MREFLAVVLMIVLTLSCIHRVSATNPVPPVTDGPGGRTSGGPR